MEVVRLIPTQAKLRHLGGEPLLKQGRRGRRGDKTAVPISATRARDKGERL